MDRAGAQKIISLGNEQDRRELGQGGVPGGVAEHHVVYAAFLGCNSLARTSAFPRATAVRASAA
jgi:hypothetical protein